MVKRIWQESKYNKALGRWSALYVTMNPAGVIHVSNHTYQLAGEPEAFRLLFDRVNTTIGLQPCRKTAQNAYPVGQRCGHRGVIIRAFTFTQEFSIRLNETVRFLEIELDEDGILVLDLRKVKSGAKPKKRLVNAKVRDDR